MASSEQTKKDLALGIVDFLTSSISDGTVSADDKESVEVAIECLSDVFNVDLDNKTKVFGNQSLLTLFSAFQKLQASKESAKSAAAASEDSKPVSTVSDEDKAKAEVFKLEGNKAMGARSYPEAISAYTKAIELNPHNAIYHSNRAAAYSSSRDHEKAIVDANQALKVDPNYSKAYSRLGLAHYALGDPQASMEAYKNGLAIEGDKQSDAMKRGYETAKKRAEEELDAGSNTADGESSALAESKAGDAADSSAAAGFGGFPDLAGLAGGAGGGFPDLSALMQNPQIAKMAQNFMSNPSALNDMMSNPQMRKMAESMQGGGGMPNMADLMSNPALQDMAKNFMGGAGK